MEEERIAADALFRAVAEKDHEGLAKLAALQLHAAVACTPVESVPSDDMNFRSLFTPSTSNPSEEYKHSSAACNDLLRELGSFLQGQTERRQSRSRPQHPALERLMQNASVRWTETRPNPDFVVQEVDDNDDEGPPIFDGTVANATPPPLNTTSTNIGHGVGTILHLACSVDNPLGLAFLLCLGASTNSTHTAFRRLVLHEAACNGSLNCLKLLLEHADTQPVVEKSSMFSSLPFLPRRSDNGSSFLPPHPPTLEELLEEEDETMMDAADTTMNTPKQDFVSLLYLFRELTSQVQRGELTELEAAQQLLRDSPPPKSNTSSRPLADGHGNTPLHWAAFKNEMDCVKLLLEHGANVNARAHPSGWTPLHDAAYSNSKECIGILVEAGGRVNARANSGATPLCFAAQEDSAEAAALLLTYGADLRTRCAGGPVRNDNTIGEQNNPHHPHSRFSGYTPLHYCAHYNAHRAARVLLQHQDARRALEMSDLSDRLPIHVAVARGSAQVLWELLHAGARVETNAHTSPPSPLTLAPTAPRRRPPAPERTFTPPRRSTSSSSPVSSPMLRAMIPSQPVMSSKPWNCLSQKDIDACRDLIGQAEASWSKDRHVLFTPMDRRAVAEVLKVGLRLEQRDGIFVDLWPLVLQFCGRGWFESENVEMTDTSESSSLYVDYMAESDDDLALPQF